MLVTVPVGTVLRVRIDDHLSSHTSSVGQQFHGTVIQDVAAEGRVAVRSGSTVIGRVTEATPAQKIGGRARLSLDFDTLEVGSVQRPMSAQFGQAGKSQTAKDAAIIGGSTNGILHLTAIAGRAGVPVSLERFNRLSDAIEAQGTSRFFSNHIAPSAKEAPAT